MTEHSIFAFCSPREIWKRKMGKRRGRKSKACANGVRGGRDSRDGKEGADAPKVVSELKLRPPKKRAALLIDNFRKTRAIRNYIQPKQNNHHDQILIDTFVDPLLCQLMQDR